MGLVIILAIGLGVLWLAIVVYTASMLKRPPRRTYASAVSRGRAGDPSELAEPRMFRTWSFRSSTGSELPAWDIDGDDPGGPIIVLTHGWADSRIGALQRVPALAPIASRLILWDLRGHGEAPGTSTLGPRERDDLLALLQHLQPPPGRGEPPAAPQPRLAIVLYGWSLGAGLSIEAAAQPGAPEITGIIAEAPYRELATPARNVLTARGLPHKATLRPALMLVSPRLWLSGAYRGFDRAAWAARLPCPLLVLHGELDAISPADDARAIAAAAPSGRLAEIAAAGHNDLWTNPRYAEEATLVVQEFIRGLAETSLAPTSGKTAAAGATPSHTAPDTLRP